MDIVEGILKCAIEMCYLSSQRGWRIVVSGAWTSVGGCHHCPPQQLKRGNVAAGEKRLAQFEVGR